MSKKYSFMLDTDEEVVEAIQVRLSLWRGRPDGAIEVIATGRDRVSHTVLIIYADGGVSSPTPLHRINL
jgi:hypothetical protein